MTQPIDAAHRDEIYREVNLERSYQDDKWGGPDHDDTETEESWQRYITEYANARDRAEGYDFRKRMVKVAALAVAALESHDRKAKTKGQGEIG